MMSTRRSAFAISIHAPRTGSDRVALIVTIRQLAFQSTLPARGATLRPSTYTVSIGISIHAPRTGSDTRMKQLTEIANYFNPRSPHGERHMARL